MKINNTLKNEKKTNLVKFAIILILFSVLTLPQVTNALDFKEIEDYKITELQTINISLIATNTVSNTTFTKNTTKGTIIILNSSSAIFSWTPNLGDSQIYTIEFTASDSNESKTQETTITVTQQANPPQIISKTSDSTSHNQIITLEVQTDISATCKYSTGDSSYENMPYTFYQKNTQKTVHAGSTPSFSEGEHNIYIRCKGEQNNYMTTSEVINLNINLRPSASISMSPPPPLKDERAKISLTISEELLDKPELYYYFDDDQAKKPITLVGSGKFWEGYIIIRSTDVQRIGAFTFKGTDLTNLEGTEITSGEIFLVDSQRPDKVRSVKAAINSNSVNLEWEYDDEEADNIKEYRIYRKEGFGGTDYVDYYDSTTKSYYYDDDVDYNKAYYYKISAVDEAENEGELSQEIFLTYKPEIEQDKTTTQTAEGIIKTKETKLSDKLMYELEIKKAIIDKAVIDVQEIEKRISKATGLDKLDAIQSTSLLSIVTSQKNKIETLNKEFASLANYDLSSSEFKTATETILGKVGEEIKNTPTDIIIVDSSEYQELISDESTSELIRTYLEETQETVDDKELKNSIKENQKLQDQLTVSVKIIQSKILYPESEEEWLTIKKTINSNEAIQNVKIIESIPKSVVKIEDISFGEKPDLLNDANICSWDIPSLTKKSVIYSFKKKSLNLLDAKQSKTVIFKIKESDTEQNAITGLATGDENTNAQNSPLWIPVIVGIIIITGLIAYYFYSSEDKNIEKHGFLSKGLISLRRKDAGRASIIPKDDSHKIIKFDNDLTNKQQLPAVGNYGQNLPNELPSDTRLKQYEHPEENVQNKNPAQDALAQNFLNDSAIEEDSLERNDSQIREIQKENFEREQQEYKHNLEERSSNYNRRTINEANQADVVDAEIEDAYERLSRFKDEWEYNPDLSIDKLHAIQKKTSMLRNLLDDIEEKNLEVYTDNTKRALKEALRFMNKKERENVIGAVERKSILDKRVPEQNAFVLKDGVKLRSLRDLKDHLSFMNDDVYNYHVTDSKNDFSSWVKDVLIQDDIAQEISNLHSKKIMYDYLSRI